MVNSNKILFIPEGDVGNIQVYFDGKSPEIATALAECVRASATAIVPPAVTRRDNAIEPPSLDLPAKAAINNTL